MKPRATPEQIAEARRLAELGVPLAKIAREHGVIWTTVKAWVDEQYRREVLDYTAANWRAVNLPHALHQQVAVEAKRRGLSVAGLVREFVLQGLGEEGKA